MAINGFARFLLRKGLINGGKAKSLTKSLNRKLSSYAHGASDKPLLFETIGSRLLSAVESVPDRTLFVFDHQNIRKTYQEAYADARRLAGALIYLGVQPGDRVGIWGPNYYEWVTCQMATAIAGFVQVNLNPSYQAEEAKYALEKVGVKVVITPRAFKKTDYYRTLQEIIPEIALCKEGIGNIRCPDLPNLEHIILFGEKERHKGAWNYDELMSGVGSTSEAQLKEMETRVRVDDPVNIQYTSGTTGHPKAATLTHHSLLNNSYFFGRRAGFLKDKVRLIRLRTSAVSETEGEYLFEEQTICCPLPLYHTAGCGMSVLTAVNFQRPVVFPAAHFDPVKTLEVISKERCTFMLGTPTIYIDCLGHLEDAKKRGFDISSLYGGMIGGAPIPYTLGVRLVNEMGMRNLLPLFGCTETSPVICTSLLDHPPLQRINNSGYVLDHIEVQIVDGNGNVVPRGTNGELLARGYSVMRGYYNDEEKTKKDLTADRWYHTGDTATMAEDGAISIVGRTKDLIIRGGENIYPAEIEQFLFKIPGIQDVHVIGVPDERFGEAVCAWVRLKDGVTGVTAESIREACKGKIAHYKIPRYVLIKKESEFPLTPSGKVKKFELREKSKEELGLTKVGSHFNDFNENDAEQNGEKNSTVKGQSVSQKA